MTEEKNKSTQESLKYYIAGVLGVITLLAQAKKVFDLPIEGNFIESLLSSLLVVVVVLIFFELFSLRTKGSKGRIAYIILLLLISSGLSAYFYFSTQNDVAQVITVDIPDEDTSLVAKNSGNEVGEKLEVGGNNNNSQETMLNAIDSVEIANNGNLKDTPNNNLEYINCSINVGVPNVVGNVLGVDTDLFTEAIVNATSDEHGVLRFYLPKIDEQFIIEAENKTHKGKDGFNFYAKSTYSLKLHKK